MTVATPAVIRIVKNRKKVSHKSPIKSPIPHHPEDMDLINALKAEGVETVCKRCFLSIKRHEVFPNLVLFKYEQTQSSFNDPVVRDARGIVLDENNDWKPVVFPYTKFFNYHESLAHVLDWSKPVKVTEKSDGSLMTIYFYQGEWRVSTQGKPEAGGKLATFKSGAPKLADEEWKKVPTYAKAFWELWEKEGYLFPSDCFSSLEQVIEASKKLNGIEQEGFICCDANFNRVKIKSPMYVTISLLRGDVFTTTGLDKRRLLQIARMNEGEELLSYFPQFTEAYQEQLNRFNKLVQHVETTYASFKDIKDDKEYADALKRDCPKSLLSLLFKLRKGTSAREFFAKVEMRLLEEAYLKPFEEGEHVLDAFREAASQKKSKAQAKKNSEPKK